jgi:hypothetical protein
LQAGQCLGGSERGCVRMAGGGSALLPSGRQIPRFGSALRLVGCRCRRTKQIEAAFVSTNSITQGEQVGVLWGWMLGHGVKIHFAHRTFAWTNEARGKAAVHCVIVGFGLEDVPEKFIFEYEDIRGEAHATKAGNINPYLVDAPDLVLPRRSKPICDVPMIGIGSQPIDDGNYLFKTDEKIAFLEKEPAAAPYFRRWIGAHEFLNGYERWCLWLGECSPTDLRKMPEVIKRVEAVRKFRLGSKRKQTISAAENPMNFGSELISKSAYLLVPKVSSEKRRFVPIAFELPSTFCSDLVFMLPDATLFHFGVLTSTAHNAWLRAVCGRLKSDFRYSAAVVYNNFPWPEPTDKQKAAIESAAQGVLDARAAHPGASLADLYDPLSMPPDLVKAHKKLDSAVDAAYGYKGGNSDAPRVAFLFELYQKLTSLLPALNTKTKSN